METAPVCRKTCREPWAKGWGDFYGLAMLSQASDPIDGVYALGGMHCSMVSGGGTQLLLWHPPLSEGDHVIHRRPEQQAAQSDDICGC